MTCSIIAIIVRAYILKNIFHASLCACMTLLCDIQINSDATWEESRLMTVLHSFVIIPLLFGVCYIRFMT